jgi:thiamine pyrophosphate-dependent acetolactate synthase large subunit-like protein
MRVAETPQYGELSMKFHEVVARALANQGVRTVFGVLGDANLYMMDSFERHVGGRYVSTSHEAGAVLAANGYARTTGELGVACVTHGPALTNTVTALVESVKDHTPLLLIAGDTAVDDPDNLQNIAQREVVLSSGAGFHQVRSAATVAEDVTLAVRRAVLERRPVVLNVPVELQWADAEYRSLSPRYVEAQATTPAADAVESAVGVIAASRRPVVLAGRGATDPGSRAALIRLAARIGAPLATTLRGKDLFRGEPFDLGVCGGLASPLALETLLRSDCVIAFGAGLNQWTTAEGSLTEKAAVIHVDIAPEAIGRWTAVTVGVVGDAGVVADTIVGYLDQAEIPATGFASPELSAALARAERPAQRPAATPGTVDIRAAIALLDEKFPPHRSLVLDGGRFIFTAFTSLHVPVPSAYVHTVNYGSIGLGMGNAIGAAAGVPERPVLLVAGDGGFMLGGLTEFVTAVRHGMDIVVVVLNDGAYGAEHIQFRRRGMDPQISTFNWPDLGPVATALGGRGHTVRSLDELRAALDTLAGRDRPVLIDVKIDPDAVGTAGH